jgi:hypothetical protein
MGDGSTRGWTDSKLELIKIQLLDRVHEEGKDGEIPVLYTYAEDLADGSVDPKHPWQSLPHSPITDHAGEVEEHPSGNVHHVPVGRAESERLQPGSGRQVHTGCQ